MLSVRWHLRVLGVNNFCFSANYIIVSFFTITESVPFVSLMCTQSHFLANCPSSPMNIIIRENSLRVVDEYEHRQRKFFFCLAFNYTRLENEKSYPWRHSSSSHSRNCVYFTINFCIQTHHHHQTWWSATIHRNSLPLIGFADILLRIVNFSDFSNYKLFF